MDALANPVINSPYDEPARHFVLDAQGRPTGEVAETRRQSEFFVPIPKPKKGGKAKSAAPTLDLDSLTDERIEKNDKIDQLRDLAAQNRRSLVLAIEEPESFLHPAAQEGIRSELESLAQQADVTLLVTTHSPHIVSRAATTLVTKVAKDASGVTHLSDGIAGTQRLSTMFGAMYGDPDFLEFLESSLRLDNTVHTVVVTEGYTDGAFIESACRAAGRDDLVDGVAFLPAGGTTRIVSAAVLARAATSRPVLALLDWDENGKVAFERLTSIQHDWNKNTNVLSLQKWPDRCRTGHEVEIEDLLDPELVQQVVDELGHAVAVDSTQACRASGITHVRLSTAWKDAVVENLDVLFSAHQNSAGLIWLAEEIQRRATTLRDS